MAKYFIKRPIKLSSNNSQLPYDKRDEARVLGQKFHVNGIPALVVVDPKTGNCASEDGRTLITSDPSGDSVIKAV